MRFELGLVCIAVGLLGMFEASQPRVAVAQEAEVETILDAAGTFRRLGFLAAGAPVPFVASFHSLAGPTPDSTLVIMGISMSGRALNFERIRTAFVADYSVEVILRDGAREISVRDDETVRVGSIADTRRADETIIFQRVLRVPAGRYEASVAVIDASSGERAAAHGIVEVPQIERGTLSSLVPVYSATARDSLSQQLDFISNPRSTVTFGFDTAYFYVEGYDLEPTTPVDIWIVDGTGTVVWRDGLDFGGGREVEGTVLGLPPSILEVGELTLNLRQRDRGALHQIPVVVSFAAQWVGTDLNALLSLLRYVPWRAAIDTLTAATSGRRIALWRQFWQATDPNPRTSKNEFLEAYFDRVVEANDELRETGIVGWLTERGEVFITLGQPTEIREVRSLQGLGASAIRWVYDQYELSLDFVVDQAGFGRFTLTAASRQEFERQVERMLEGSN